MHRRPFLFASAALAASAGLGACGFKLRSSQPLAFQSLAVTPENSGGVAGDLARYFGDLRRPVAPSSPELAPEVVLAVLEEAREKVVVGMNSSGQVREFQLRLRVRFFLRSFSGEPLIEPTTLEQTRDISFNESAVLAKEAEEALLYRDMQADMVQQIVRRLGALKSLPGQTPAAP